jgi:predicted RND superfamily exporter protein
MKALSRLFTYSLRNPGIVVAVALIMAAVSAFFASRLPVDTDIANLLPRDNPHVEAMYRLTETLGGEDRVEVIVAAGDFMRNQEVAEALALRLMKLTYAREGSALPLFVGYELRFDSQIIRDNVLYFMNESELDRLESWLTDLREDAAMRANPFFVDFEDDFSDETGGADESGNWLALDLPSEYIINRDSTKLLFRLVPSGSKGDIGYVTTLFAMLDAAIEEFEHDFAQASNMHFGGGSYDGPGVNADHSPSEQDERTNHHLRDGSKDTVTTPAPNDRNRASLIRETKSETAHELKVDAPNASDPLQIVYGGNLRNHLTKFDDINATLQFAVVFGVTGLLIFLIFYTGYLARRYVIPRGLPKIWLRVPLWSLSMIVIIGLSLGLSLLITYASAWFLFGELNIMTTVLVAILLGVNLDYVLHFISVFMERRAVTGRTRAIAGTFQTCGKALLISCLTSCLAMLILLFSGFRGFSEFGTLFFVGILSTYLITISLFSMLIVWLDRVFFDDGDRSEVDIARHSVAMAGSGDARNRIAKVGDGNSLDERESLDDSRILCEIDYQDGSGDRDDSGRCGESNSQDNDNILYSRRSLIDKRGQDDNSGLDFILKRAAVPAIGLMVLLLVIATVSLPGSAFEYAFYKLEPRLTEEPLFRTMRDTFDDQYRSDPAYFLFETREAAREAAARLSDSAVHTTIGHVESFHDRFPIGNDEVGRKMERISTIRNLVESPLIAEAIQQRLDGVGSETDYIDTETTIDERNRNVDRALNTASEPASPPDPAKGINVRGGQSNSDWRDLSEQKVLEILLRAASQTEPIAFSDLPEFIVNRFTGGDGSLANLVIIYPNMMLADGRASLRFRDDAGKVTVGERTYAAASTALIGASILQIMQREAWWLMFFPLLTAGSLLIVFFRSWKWGVLAFAPLAAGLLLLTGGMAFFGIKFNIYNIIVLPAVLGVGADNGVHLFHRLRQLRREMRRESRNVLSGLPGQQFSDTNNIPGELSSDLSEELTRKTHHGLPRELPEKFPNELPSVGYEKLRREITERGGVAPIKTESPVARLLKSTGVYITASSVTTILGFAGLLFTGHPGLQSMGLVAVSGIGLTLVCAVVLAMFYDRLYQKNNYPGKS